MIPTNGFIQVRTVSGGGVDESGNPVKATTAWGDKIPCRIQTNTNNKEGRYQDGKFIISSYIIFLQKREFTAERIKVILQEVEREFDVQDLQILGLVGQVKITV